MNRLFPVLGSCLVVGGFIVCSAWAQSGSEPPATPPALAAPAPAPAAAPAAPPVAKSIDDPELAAALAAGMPKYDPPKPAEPPPDDANLPDMRDIDKPKNEIIRLPKYVVRQAPPPIFTERQIYTDQGLADLAVKRYLSDFDRNFLNKSILPFFGESNEARALQQYAEDERLKNISDLNDTADAITRGGDAAGGEYIKRQTQETFMRTIDWGGPPIHP